MIYKYKIHIANTKYPHVKGRLTELRDFVLCAVVGVKFLKDNVNLDIGDSEGI